MKQQLQSQLTVSLETGERSEKIEFMIRLYRKSQVYRGEIYLLREYPVYVRKCMVTAVTEHVSYVLYAVDKITAKR